MDPELEDDQQGDGLAPDVVDRDEVVKPFIRRKGRSGAVTVLGAAMLAVGDILEPEKTTVEIVQTDDDPDPDLPFTLNFGSLPPLD